uniref:Uncharacterized protein n=1 Tax=Populus trichocarpa TaxID=3694 RepID=A0A2K2ADK5_POPTR|eukprot:XP_024456791.1 uncharacterized protein LOC7477127 isoform X1 [Populus trichocarpa]
MFDLGDELTVEGYRIPWLIWIQILILVLLVILLFCFSFFPSDLSDTTTSSSSASPSAVGVFMPLNSNLDKQTLEHNDHTTTATDCLQHSQVHQNKSIKGEITTNTGRRIETNLSREKSVQEICCHLLKRRSILTRTTDPRE